MLEHYTFFDMDGGQFSVPDPHRAASWLLGRRPSNYLIVKEDDNGRRAVVLTAPYDHTSVMEQLKRA